MLAEKITCADCEKDLTGQPQLQPCPECGSWERLALFRAPPPVTWERIKLTEGDDDG